MNICSPLVKTRVYFSYKQNITGDPITTDTFLNKQVKRWLDLSKILKIDQIISKGPHKYQKQKRNPKNANFYEEVEKIRDHIFTGIYKDAETQPSGIFSINPPLEDPKMFFFFFFSLKTKPTRRDYELQVVQDSDRKKRYRSHLHT